MKILMEVQTICIFCLCEQATGILIVFYNVFFMVKTSGFLYHKKEAEVTSEKYIISH